MIKNSLLFYLGDDNIKKIRLKNNNFCKTKSILVVFFCTLIIVLISLFYSESIFNNITKKYNYSNIDYSKMLAYSAMNKVADYSDLYLFNDDYNTLDESIETTIIDEIDIDVYNDKPIVYIYNSHDTEKYSSPFTSDYTITPDVKLASYILKDYLNDNGIAAYVEKNKITPYLNKHNLSYTGCYTASRYYAKNAMKDNDFKILIDLHRDSVKHKYTLYKKDNKKYAKVMFVMSTKHDNYKKNFEFANALIKIIDEDYKGLSRGIYKRTDFHFNQDLSNKAILIELGGVDNTLEEINNTLLVLAEVISKYLDGEN